MQANQDFSPDRAEASTARPIKSIGARMIHQMKTEYFHWISVISSSVEFIGHRHEVIEDGNYVITDRTGGAVMER
jgi:hypothetical protein